MCVSRSVTTRRSSSHGRHYQTLGHLCVRVGPVALSRLQPITGRRRWDMNTAAFVEEVGSAVKSVKPGQFVIGSFSTSDNTCPNCRSGYQSSCLHSEFIHQAQAPCCASRSADGTLVATPDVPPDDLIPSLLSFRRLGHRLVRRRRCQRETGKHGHSRWRRRGRTPWCPVGQADGRRADHCDEPP